MTARDVCVSAIIAVVGTFGALPAGSQAITPPADTAGVQTLRPVVIVAERVAAPVASSTAAISVLGARELSRRPLRSLADAVQHAPGLTFVDFDGLGGDPQLMVRGFYGGGEAEYVVLLLDGRPVNALETGRINWDLIPLSAVQSIEIVRGGASAAWGDAALGGVINVITTRDAGRSVRGMLAGGDHGSMRASASVFDSWDDRPISAFGSFSRSEGFRDHAERSNGGINASIGLVKSEAGTLSLSTVNDWRSFDEPGPVAGTSTGTRSDPFYRFDNAEERTHRLSFDGSRSMGSAKHVRASLTGEYRHADRVRTLPLAPDFADTKNRVLATSRLLASSQIEIDALPLPGDDALVAGLEASAGRMSSKYHDFFLGQSADYASATPSRGDLDERGTAMRSSVAGFVHYGLQATSALRFTAGGRLDWLSDDFESRAPSDPVSYSATHLAFSPKVGANLRFIASARNEAHIYANVARSFKAPTPDQLFDQRMIPAGPDPITFSNPGLEPQYGTSIEAGVNHRADLIPERFISRLTISAYTMDVRDELDFDISTFRYQNIGRSRHRGLESSLDLAAPLVDVFANYTLQDATSRIGDDFGKQLKAIPRHFIVAGATIGNAAAAKASIVASSARRIYLDDANTRELDGWTRWDARLSYAIRGVNLFADVFNLFDAEYSSTGFPDPSGTDTIFYYPAARRTLQAGLSWEM
jgi:outer membrane receptor protein involved in Fe transport